MDAHTSVEYSAVIDQVASCPRGMEIFRESCLESAAITLGMHPFAIAAARAYVEECLGWSAFGDAVRRVSGDRPNGVVSVAGVRSADSPEAEALMREVERASGGVDALRRGKAEEVACRHRVHPYLVYRAREMLERRELQETKDQGPRTKD